MVMNSKQCTDAATFFENVLLREAVDFDQTIRGRTSEKIRRSRHIQSQA